LERFASPQNVLEMATLGSTPISTHYFQLQIGGDLALLKGICKRLIEMDDTARQEKRAGISTRHSLPRTPAG